MPRARLTLTIPENVWIGDVSRTYPDTAFRILAALANEEGGVGLVELTGPDVPEAVAALRATDEIADLSLIQQQDEEALVQFETTLPLLLLPMQGSGTPLELPFTIRDGQAEWTVTASHDRLSALGDQLREFGIPFSVDYIRKEWETDSLLTEHQQQLIAAAVERGYYDTPRECSLTQLADELDMAKSTVSETLHRAEERIVKEFLSETQRSAEPAPQT